MALVTDNIHIDELISASLGTISWSLRLRDDSHAAFDSNCIM